MIVIETDRLRIRESSGRDFSRIYSLMLSESTKGTILDEVSSDEDEELEKYLAYIHTVYSVFGFGLWTVERREDGEIIGRCGLQPIADENSPLGRIEIGYLIDPACRGQGYGYEACRAILDFAFERLEIDEVYALIDEGNATSLNLARKLGFVQKEAGVWAAENPQNDCGE